MDRNEAAALADTQPGTMPADEVRKVLADLTQTCRDGELGFSAAAEEVDDPAVAALFRKLGSRRGAMVAELAEVGARYGFTADQDGSVAGALHRGWIKLKDAMTAGDHAVIAAAEEGEDHAVEQFSEALEAGLPAPVATVLRRLYTEVVEAHDQVRGLEIATDRG